MVGTVVQMVTNGMGAEYRLMMPRKRWTSAFASPRPTAGWRCWNNSPANATGVRAPIELRHPITLPNVDTIQRVDGTSRIHPGERRPWGARGRQGEGNQRLAGHGDDPRLTVTFRGANEEQEAAMGSYWSLPPVPSPDVRAAGDPVQQLLSGRAILFAVVMSTGVLLGLVVTGQPFSAILTGVGIVALAGIVVNNNIVLIDTFNGLRRERPDLDTLDLIVRTGAQRLRPVFLTTVTTIFGLLPIASHISVDIIAREVVLGGRTASFWVPLAQSIVSGLTFATLLTLIATPAMLALPERARELVRPLRRRLRRAPKEEGLRKAAS